MSSPHWFTSATGKTIYLTEPEQSVVDVEDIALALSRQCRFAGHLRKGVEHYSVAQHSVMVSLICAPENALVGLLHDATEAYVQDIISPLKRLLGERYKALENQWALAIGERFGLDRKLVNLPADVKQADLVALVTEKRDLMAPSPVWQAQWEAAPLRNRIVPLPPETARDAFMHRFESLQSPQLLHGASPCGSVP